MNEKMGQAMSAKTGDGWDGWGVVLEKCDRRQAARVRAGVRRCGFEVVGGMPIEGGGGNELTFVNGNNLRSERWVWRGRHWVCFCSP